MPRSSFATTKPAECLVWGAARLPDLLARRVRATPDRTAYRWRVGATEHVLTWRAFQNEVDRYRSALGGCGLEPGQRVALCTRNRIEWLLFEQAALAQALVVVPLFFNDRTDNLAWCLQDSGSQWLLLENGSRWPELSAACPGLQAVVLEHGPQAGPHAFPLVEWLSRTGAPRLPQTGRAELATIVYTSGTTGRPKGVQLTHGNILADLEGVLAAVPELGDRWQRALSFLPLSHMLERTLGEYLSMAAGWELCFGESVQTLLPDLEWARPTVLVAVPRVLEKVYQRLQESLAAAPVRRFLFERTVRIGWRRFRRRASWLQQLEWLLLDWLVARRVRAVFGGALRAVFLGGAPTAPVLLRCFTGLGFTLVQGYGLTETAPVATCNRIQDNEPYSVGRPLPGVEARVTGEGELWLRGAIVSTGYWRNPEATAEAFGPDGWFRTGDRARMESGRLYITGRLKEIIVLSNGEKIAPADAERAIQEDPVFSQVLLVGEGRPALTLLAVTALTDPAEALRRANARLGRFPGYARIRYATLLEDPWTVDNGLLTPTLKLKRSEIERKFADVVAAGYAQHVAPAPPGRPDAPL